MPKPPEVTPFRRILEQAIMWIVLGATVGAAAMVNAKSNRLGPPRTFGPVTIRVPEDFRPTEEDGDGRIEVRERGEELFARTVTVRYVAPSFSLNALLGPRPKRIRSEQVELPAFGDGAVATVELLRRVVEDPLGRGAYPEFEVLATVPQPDGKVLTISIRQFDWGEGSGRDVNVKLMKRILQTLRIADQD